MKKATGKTGRNRKGSGTGLSAVSLIISFQVVGLVLFLMATQGSVEAKTFTVTSTLDETDTAPGDGVCVSPSDYCTLRAAIQEANALPGPDIIKLKTALYMLTIPGRSEDGCATGDLDITDDLTIIGTGAQNTFINIDKLDRVFHIIGLFSISITNVTIQNGLATVGGGIYNSGSSLTLKGSSISNNSVSGGSTAFGGGIFNSGTLTITKSTLSNNSVSGGNDAYGGGIYNSGTLTITGSTISNNTASSAPVCAAGGIMNYGTLIIKGSTISNNTVSSNPASISYGGAVYNSGGTLTVAQSTISNNTALGGNDALGGGIFNDVGPLTITGGKISNNVARGDFIGKGGGICGFYGEVTVKGCTISGNAASGKSLPGTGGGIYLEDGALTVQNAGKIIQNFASDEGGGIFIVGSATASISSDSTLAKNIPDDKNF
jgi:CSLREA domain-containing protein